MAEFVAEEGLLAGLTLSLREGDVWTIGRDPESSDLIVEDPKVSRKHLICRKTEEGYVLENLSLTNPTKVNDVVLVDPVVLKNGDRVAIGTTTFRFAVTSSEPEEFPPLQEPEKHEEAVFQDEEPSQIPKVHFDLSESERFVFKVISGPNTGAELALELGKEYLIGTDTTTCHIIFHDLSVSRQHAKLTTTAQGQIFIEDLDSRNGVVVEREKISTKTELAPNAIVTIGTSSFLVIDREAPLATIAAPVFEREEEIVSESPELEPVLEKQEEIKPVAPKAPRKPLPIGSLLLSVLLIGLVALFGVGIVSLFQETPLEAHHEDYDLQLRKALARFPAVKYTFNSALGRLFLEGHVANGIEKSEVLYTLKSLPFIRSIDDYLVDDEAVWEETNILLSKNKEFEGLCAHAPEPGHFVISGFLDKSSQFAHLQDYMCLHFPYLKLLSYQIVVKDEVLTQVAGLLGQGGFSGVSAEFLNGDLTLTGFVPKENLPEYKSILKKIEAIVGVKEVRSYVVELEHTQCVIDLNEKEPGRYCVTGYSKHCDVNINVVINGCLLMRGDMIDGMTVMSIQAHTVFLEKDGCKYKIEYNTQRCPSGCKGS